jgi:hypothetical protein
MLQEFRKFTFKICSKGVFMEFGKSNDIANIDFTLPTDHPASYQVLKAYAA